VVVDREGVKMREQAELAPTRARRGRGCLVWLGGAAAVLLGL